MASMKGRLGLWALAVMAMAAGCQSSNLPGPSGTVSGTATYQDRPIPAGSAIVLVHKQSGIIASGVTDSSGRFHVQMRDRPEVLVGEYAVNVVPPGEIPETVSVVTEKNAPEAWKKVPKAYWSQTTSPETYAVKEGENDYKFVLHD